jgi:hypothetical protein
MRPETAKGCELVGGELCHATMMPAVAARAARHQTFPSTTSSLFTSYIPLLGMWDGARLSGGQQWVVGLAGSTADPKGARMKLARTTLARLVVVVLLAGGLVAVVPAPAKAPLTLRTCTSDTNEDIVTGDGVRKLSICSRGWVNGNVATQTRGVVEMHTYELSYYHTWVDSRSQSITIESAKIFGYERHPSVYWGQIEGGNCRVNAPNGSTGCSVANAVAVDFYGPGIAVTGRGDPFNNWVYYVSWRDDRGVPHRLVPVQVGPDDLPLVSPRWSA